MDMFMDIEGPVLCVGAHPEDLEIHAGGTVARLVEAEVEVSYVLCTSGNRGTGDPEATMEAVGARREREQQLAAEHLGVVDITFLRHDDGDLQYMARDLRQEIARLIRLKRPRSVITHDPLPGPGSHDSCALYPDHLTVGKVVFEAAFICAPGPLFYPAQIKAGLAPHKPDALYFIMSQSPNVFVDVQPVWERKLAAIQVHASQGRHLPGVENFFQRIAWQVGHIQGLALAESFRRLLPT